jgi:hypothetical protein
MDLFRYKGKIGFSIRAIPVLVMVVFFLVLTGLSGHPAQQKQEGTFTSPEEAFKTLVEALQTENKSQVVALIGPEGRTLFSAEARWSGQTIDRFLKEYNEKKRLEKVGNNKVVLHVGPQDWPWPIPVVKVGTQWRFDIKQGRKEILARRIGANETAAVQVCLAYVDAQREYAREHPTTKGLGEYAQKFMSDQGEKNGLCWISAKEEKQGPMGPMLASACPTSYSGARPEGRPTPYYGYYYKILKRQGKDAPGGAYNYIVDGQMIGGFGLVAYPAFYRRSGIMTFIINQDGQVYEKNLGEKTGKIAGALKEFNPDNTWEKVD